MEISVYVFNFFLFSKMALILHPFLLFGICLLNKLIIFRKSRVYLN